MSPKRILLIDDEADIREVASMTLETIGDFQVITASSGAAGIDVARRERPDAILLDVMMPEMDGPTTFAHLQQTEETRAIPVIFLTAKVQATDRQQLSNLGAAGLIAKPFDPMTFSDEVAAVLAAANVRNLDDSRNPNSEPLA